MYISKPYDGVVYYAKKSERTNKYVWFAVQYTTLEERRVAAALVPRRIRKLAYNLFYRLESVAERTV
jgi:hypothetical protein